MITESVSKLSGRMVYGPNVRVLFKDLFGTIHHLPVIRVESIVGETIVCVGQVPKEIDCRIELVNAIHILASHYENRLHRLDEDDRKLAEGDIAHAMKIAAKWNWNGTGVKP